MKELVLKFFAIHFSLPFYFADMASHCSSNAIHSPLHWFRSDVQCCLYRVFRASQSVLGHAALSRFPPILGHTNSQLYFSIHPAVNTRFLLFTQMMYVVQIRYTV